jgi:pyridoxamine 5'-phosphate oxidase-like protein
VNITRATLLTFLRSRRYAVQSSLHGGGAPQSAIVGVAVSDEFEIIFDTLGGSRKGQNLRHRPDIAFVFGSLEGADERTVQYEGTADEPQGAERERLTELYFGVFPDGRERQKWPGLTYFRATPQWLRYSDYNVDPPVILEWDAAALRRLK